VAEFNRLKEFGADRRREENGAAVMSGCAQSRGGGAITADASTWVRSNYTPPPCSAELAAHNKEASPCGDRGSCGAPEGSNDARPDAADRWPTVSSHLAPTRTRTAGGTAGQ
jgi:hypothetical protein